MPTYEWRCPVCGARRTVVRAMADAGQPVECRVCAEAMRRVWQVPALIVRPHGYHLRPGEPGYWDVNRALEVGHVPAPDASSNLGAGAPTDEQLEAEEYAGVRLAQPDEDGMQKLAEVARASFSESGSRL
jgi:putative FmdB family regulatory protein